jgi:hypothetical protein
MAGSYSGIEEDTRTVKVKCRGCGKVHGIEIFYGENTKTLIVGCDNCKRTQKGGEFEEQDY